MEINSKIFFKIFLFLYCLSTINALMFYLPANVKKCLKEEIHKDILVKGDYFISDVVGHHTKLEVTDSKGHTLYNKEDAGKGKFAFTTDEYDVFQICFYTTIKQEVVGSESLTKEVHLDVKHGVEAKDYENVKYN
jgi:hypothetical protein